MPYINKKRIKPLEVRCIVEIYASLKKTLLTYGGVVTGEKAYSMSERLSDGPVST